MNSLLFKIFVWSLVLEPLLFFVVGHRSWTGIVGNISRFLQLIVVICLLFRFIGAPAPLRRVHPLNRLYAAYTAYFLLTCVAGVYGFMTGAYTVGSDYNLDIGGFAGILNSEWARPLFEYVVAFYYFAYLVVLPQFFLHDERRLDYFFKIFFFMFGASLILGLIDVALSPLDVVFIGRHITDWISVGGRFHGFAGEPRDAFVYLILGIAMYYLRCYYARERVKRRWVALIVVAMLLTQSASGLLGIAIFLLLLICLAFARLNKYVLGLALLAAGVLPPLIYVLIENSERLLLYKEALLVVWDVLETNGEIPFVLRGQVPNIYPIYALILKARELDFIPILLGSGLGSASALNNLMGAYGELVNPNAQVIRVIYESGIVGLILMVLAFYKPVEILTAQIDPRQRRALLTLTLLLTGAFLGHRNAGLFIFVGITIAIFRLAPRSNVRVPAARACVRENEAVSPLPTTRPLAPGAPGSGAGSEGAMVTVNPAGRS